MDQISIGPLSIGHSFEFVCRDKDGREKWRETTHNLVVTTGLNDVLDKYYRGSSYSAAHYLGLKGAGTIAAGDTMASHAGWSEVTAYDEATRNALTFASPSGGSSAATGVTFTMSGTATVAGAFISTNSTKGGSTGTLIGATDFSASRSLADDDTLTVTPTATLTAS